MADLKGPDPYSDGRMPMIFEVMREVKEVAGMAPVSGYCAPPTIASHVMTFENLAIHMRENPGFAHQGIFSSPRS